jgi:CBS domain containing-hemolysin-like protein
MFGWGPEILVAVILAAIFSYSFFALGSTAIARSRTARLRELAKENYFGAKYARTILTRADAHLLSCQTGAFLSALCIGFSANELLSGVRGAWIGELLPVSPETEHLLVSFIVLAAVVLAGLALLQAAKAIAFMRPNRGLCWVALPILLSSRILWPIVWLLRATVGRALSGLGLGIPVERELAVSSEEIAEIVEMSNKAGQIEDDESEMIRHVFTFSDTIAREVMTPRKDIIAVEESASLEEVIALFIRERISRILVTGTDLDDVKGVLLGKDFLNLIGKPSADFHLRKYLRPVFFVPNSKKVDELLQELRQEAIHFAVVLDEHGGVDGVVTLEDLIEEIVGEIFDEYDSPIEELDVRSLTTGDLVVEGSTMIDDLNASRGLSIPRGHYDTIAGFVIHLLGRIPKTGEQVKWENFLFKVENTFQNRITSVRIVASSRGSSVHAGVSGTAPVAEGEGGVAPEEPSR